MLSQKPANGRLGNDFAGVGVLKPLLDTLPIWAFSVIQRFCIHPITQAFLVVIGKELSRFASTDRHPEIFRCGNEIHFVKLVEGELREFEKVVRKDEFHRIDVAEEFFCFRI